MTLIGIVYTARDTIAKNRLKYPARCKNGRGIRTVFNFIVYYIQTIFDFHLFFRLGVNKYYPIFTGRMRGKFRMAYCLLYYILKERMRLSVKNFSGEVII